MKTCKFFYSVYKECSKTNEEYLNRRCSDRSLVCFDCFGFVFVDNFPTLAMARNYCTFNKGHFVIRCEGQIEYQKGVEIK